MIALFVAALVILVLLAGTAWTGGILLGVAWHGLKAAGKIQLWVLGGCKIPRLTTDLGPEREAEIRAQIAEAKEERKARPSVWQECRDRGRESYAQTTAKIKAQKAAKHQVGSGNGTQ